MPASLRSIAILGCRVDDVGMSEAIARCDDLIRAGGPAYIVTPNAEIVVAAQSDPALREAINQSDLAIPDGAGLLLAARLLGTRLREQVTGTDLSYELAARCAERGYRLFLLGAAEGVADEAARRLRLRHPDLIVAGTFSGDSRPSGDAATCEAIRLAGPVDVLLVAYGAPRQEFWIRRNQARLGVPLAIGVGGVLDFMSGRVARAPRLIRRLGFDWLYRLVRQPWRWRRQLALPRFIWLVMLSAGRARRTVDATRSTGEEERNRRQRDNRTGEDP